MASLSTCHLGLWLGWQILLNVLVTCVLAVSVTEICIIEMIVNIQMSFEYFQSMDSFICLKVHPELNKSILN